MTNLLNPAASIITRFGGPDAVREITGASRTRVYRWTQPKGAGGTGGVIPTPHAQKLLKYAKDHGIAVSADEFLAEPREAAA